MATNENQTESSAAAPKASKKSTWRFFLWWRIDPSEVDEQISGYETLSIWNSARKLSVLCLLFSMTVSILLIHFIKLHEPYAYVDVAIMGFFAFFIWRSKQWAMLGAMLLWTLEKLIGVADSLSGPRPQGGQIVMAYIWWAIYMRAFFLAWKTENRRKELVQMGSGK